VAEYFLVIAIVFDQAILHHHKDVIVGQPLDADGVAADALLPEDLAGEIAFADALAMILRHQHAILANDLGIDG